MHWFHYKLPGFPAGNKKGSGHLGHIFQMLQESGEIEWHFYGWCVCMCVCACTSVCVSVCMDLGGEETEVGVSKYK